MPPLPVSVNDVLRLSFQDYICGKKMLGALWTRQFPEAPRPTRWLSLRRATEAATLGILFGHSRPGRGSDGIIKQPARRRNRRSHKSFPNLVKSQSVNNNAIGLVVYHDLDLTWLPCFPTNHNVHETSRSSLCAASFWSQPRHLCQKGSTSIYGPWEVKIHINTTYNNQYTLKSNIIKARTMKLPMPMLFQWSY